MLRQQRRWCSRLRLLPSRLLPLGVPRQTIVTDETMGGVGVMEAVQQQSEVKYVSVQSLVRDPQFRAGFREYLKGQAPPSLFFHPTAGGKQRVKDNWGYERGRLVAAWAITNRHALPHVSDIIGMAILYLAAKDAGAVI
jgi:hypothetical protein